MLEHIVYLPGDCIIRHGTYGDSMYFISSGTVVIRDQKYQLQQRLSKGNYFGDLALFSENRQRKANVFADTYVYVYRLNKSDLDKCLNEFPKTRKHIEEVVKERNQIYNQKHSGISVNLGGTASNFRDSI